VLSRVGFLCTELPNDEAQCYRCEELASQETDITHHLDILHAIKRRLLACRRVAAFHPDANVHTFDDRMGKDNERKETERDNVQQQKPCVDFFANFLPLD
jgi:hypothetical protein